MAWAIDYKSESGRILVTEEVADESAANAKINTETSSQAPFLAIGNKHIRRESIVIIEKRDLSQ